MIKPFLLYKSLNIKKLSLLFYISIIDKKIVIFCFDKSCIKYNKIKKYQFFSASKNASVRKSILKTYSFIANLTKYKLLEKVLKI